MPLRKLIIIRGPTGIGKTTIANALINKLGHTYLLKLDETRPDLFRSYLECSIKYENVVGEMFFGDSHTTNPSEWLNYFPDNVYEKLSFVLAGNLADCLYGVVTRKYPAHELLSLDQVRINFDDFYVKYKTIFRCMINFSEIELNYSRSVNINQIVDQILDYFKTQKS